MEQTYRDKLIDERFDRDKERIVSHEEHMKEQDGDIRDLKELTIEMSQLLKRHDERLDKQEGRLTAIEERPAKNWTAVQTAAISAAISAATSGIVAAVMALILK